MSTMELNERIRQIVSEPHIWKILDMKGKERKEYLDSLEWETMASISDSLGLPSRNIFNIMVETNTLLLDRDLLKITRDSITPDMPFSLVRDIGLTFTNDVVCNGDNLYMFVDKKPTPFEILPLSFRKRIYWRLFGKVRFGEVAVNTKKKYGLELSITNRIQDFTHMVNTYREFEFQKSNELFARTYRRHYG